MRFTEVMPICAMLALTLTGAAVAQNWSSMSYTLHEDYQAVDSNGFGTFPLNSPVKMRGVWLNRGADMLDPTPGANPFMGGQWQVYVQAVDMGDTGDDDNTFGGTACWMGQNIGKIVGNHPAGSYTDSEWLAEVERLRFDPATSRRFQPGDLIEIRARAPGMYFNGKTNINEKHSKLTARDFDLVLLQADYGLPAPEVITLDDVKDASDAFIFDSTRATGCEHYQGSVVQFNNVSFVSTTSWGPSGSLTITDGTKTFPVLLARGSGFSHYPAPTSSFDILGILDQEDDDGSDGHKAGYRLWVIDYDGSAFQLVRYALVDFNQDSVVDDTDRMHLETCLSGPAVPQTDPNCADADLDSDGDVDLYEVGIFQRCISGTELADPDCHLP